MLYVICNWMSTMGDMAREDKSVLGWFAFVVSVTALALATFGLRSGPAEGAAAAAPASVAVTLSEFRFSPLMVTLPVGGGTINISNTGTALHSFSVVAVSLTNKNI